MHPTNFAIAAGVGGVDRRPTGGYPRSSAPTRWIERILHCMATRILLIRHGETAWNLSKVFRGTYDVPLNDTGRKQAQLLADALAGRTIDAAFASPLSRAAETAELALASRDVPATVTPELIDIDYGEWTGLPDEEVSERWPEQHAAWSNSPESAEIPGGQALRSVFETASTAMANLAQRHAGRTIALFAHRVVNKVLVLAALGLELNRFGLIMQGNCCINEFEYTERGYVIHAINDTSHVRRGGAGLLTADF